MMDWPKATTYWIDGPVLNASVPFTWCLPEVRKTLSQTLFGIDGYRVGGPAVALMPDFFKDMPWVTVEAECEGVLQRVNPLATRTTIGCPNKCGFCAVPKIEPIFSELEDWPDLPVLCDNNLLAASQKHFDKVCDRLEKHEWCDFNQGLDAELMTGYHAERLSRIPGAIIRMSLDSASGMAAWEEAYCLLRTYKVALKRICTYVLIGFGSDHVDAWDRCKFVEEHKVEPYPQWYHPLDCMEHNSIMKCHLEHGWTKGKRDRIMQYYYKHRGEPL